jgi:hypothetical protein
MQTERNPDALNSRSLWKGANAAPGSFSFRRFLSRFCGLLDARAVRATHLVEPPEMNGEER